MSIHYEKKAFYRRNLSMAPKTVAEHQQDTVYGYFSLYICYGFDVYEYILVMNEFMSIYFYCWVFVCISVAGLFYRLLKKILPTGYR